MRQLLADLEMQKGEVGTDTPASRRENLASGLVERDGALLLRRQDDANAGRSRPSQFPDLTGYEAFINHVHFDRQHDNLDDLRLAVAAVDELARQVRAGPAGPPVRISVSRNLSGEYIASTVRLYRVRAGETWLVADLESYQTEAVGFVDVRPHNDASITS